MLRDDLIIVKGELDPHKQLCFLGFFFCLFVSDETHSVDTAR